MATAPTNTPWQLLVGQMADGKYHLQRLLGFGSFGGVFLASEVVNDQEIRQVAVKLILPIQGSQERQMQELIAASRLDHPNILRCFVSGQCQLAGTSFLYLVTEVAQGSLRDRFNRGVLTTDEARELVLHLASGLANLHDPSNPRVHRDLKPENVLRVGDFWKIADFGLVRELGMRSVQQTTQGIGTAAYAPPEFYQGQSMISTAWDTWSLGVILVEALTGRNPFESPNIDLGIAVQNQEPALTAAVVSPFDQIARGCLAKDRAARWNAQQVLTALRGGQVRVADVPSVPTPDSIRPPNRIVWLAAAVVVVLVGVLLYHFHQPDVTPVGVTGPVSSNPVGAAPKSSAQPPLAPPSATPAARESGSPSRQPPEASVLPTPPKAAPWNPSLAFTSSAEEIERGTATTLVWAVEGSSDVRLDGEVVPARGNRTVSPNETTVYRLVAYGPGNATSDRQVTVVVTLPRVVSPAPTIAAFEVVPNPVDQCAIAILRWTVKNATTVTIEPGIGTVNPSGYRAWKPLQSAQFTLKADGPGGTASRDVTFSVNHAVRTTCGQ